MSGKSLIPRLTDILEAIQRIRNVTENISLEEFETDWKKKWIVERGIEIISEASRYLPEEMKARYAHIPWRKVAGIGNVLRHDYERIAPPIMWKLVREDLDPIEKACRSELTASQNKDRQ
jgi:uncharacterized protein with HEPN domain